MTKGISYVNESGSEGFIDFEECYQNYLKRWLNQDAYEEFKKFNPNFVKTYEEYAERKKKWKEIGRRNVLGSKYGYDKFTFDSDNPYFVFIQQPPLSSNVRRIQTNTELFVTAVRSTAGAHSI